MEEVDTHGQRWPSKADARVSERKQHIVVARAISSINEGVVGLRQHAGTGLEHGLDGTPWGCNGIRTLYELQSISWIVGPF